MLDVVLTGLLVAALLVLAGFLTVAARRRVLHRRGGTFDCSLREAGRATTRSDTAKGWMLGIARYSGDQLDWYRVFSLSPRPHTRLPRRRLEVAGRRPPGGAEAYALLPGAVVVECRRGEAVEVELGMSEGALTGFLSWLEAAPPGQNVSVA